MIWSAIPKVMWVGRARTRAFFFVAVMVAASIGVLLAANPAHAAEFTVKSTDDEGDRTPGDGICATLVPAGFEPDCTLRAAIEEANANGEEDTIVFDQALSGTITLTLGQLVIANDTPAADLSIHGPGASRITVSGNNASRVFRISDGADATISGLTISNGSTDIGGGIYNIGTLKLSNSTVSGNTATSGSSGGGIYSNSVGTMTLSNTIVARNSATTKPDASGSFTSDGNNLIGDTTGSSGWGTSDLQNVNPLLGPLQNNGGPTDTHALLPGSPAVDAANNTACPFTDQRGEARKDGDGNGTIVCDIGAFEKETAPPPPPPPPPNVAPVARANSYSVKEDAILRVPRLRGVLANDSDANGDRLTARKVTTTRHGTLTLRADGSLVYNSRRNFAGIDTFYYRAFDGKALSNKAKVTIRVRPVAG